MNPPPPLAPTIPNGTRTVLPKSEDSQSASRANCAGSKQRPARVQAPVQFLADFELARQLGRGAEDAFPRDATISEWIKDDDAFSEVFMRGGKKGKRSEFLQEGDTVPCRL
jgi:hypothetical protein